MATSKSKATTKKVAKPKAARPNADQASPATKRVRMKDPDTGAVVRVPVGTILTNAKGNEYVLIQKRKKKLTAVKACYAEEKGFQKLVAEFSTSDILPSRLEEMEIWLMKSDDRETGMTFTELQWIVRKAASLKNAK